MQHVSCGAAHTAMVTSGDGSVYTCGAGSVGQLGCGTVVEQVLRPAKVGGALAGKACASVCCGEEQPTVLFSPSL